MNVQSVTFFPVPPVKAIVYPRPDAPVEDKRVQPQRPPPAGPVGRVFDFKV